VDPPELASQRDQNELDVQAVGEAAGAQEAVASCARLVERIPTEYIEVAGGGRSEEAGGVCAGDAGGECVIVEIDVVVAGARRVAADQRVHPVP
jgi:hypothetical protein